jgi:hypothetical protein
MRAFIVFLSFLLLLVLPGCHKSDPKPTEEARITTLLTKDSGKWAPSATAGITVDGLDVTTDLFKDFTITFTADKIFTTGKTPVWLREDTWHFKDATGKIILRGQDNKEITVESVSETELQLILKWDQTTYEEGGRKKSIPGTFVFTLNK